MADVAELEVRVTDRGVTQVQQRLGGLDRAFSGTAARIITVNQALDLMERAARALVSPLQAVVREGIAFESAFAGVRKTVNATPAELARLRSEFVAMSRVIPVAATEISNVGAAAGQLGIHVENITKFTDTMVKLGVSTNLASTEAAQALARFSNITKLPQTDIDRLGATIVALGNNSATTEREIVEMGLRIAGAGRQVGLTDAQILGLSASLSSVGVDAELGGSAVQRVLIEMASAAASGGPRLAAFAKTIDESTQATQRLIATDPGEAFSRFVEGLARVGAEGGNVFATLDQLGLSEIRTTSALTRLANAGDLTRRSMGLATDAFRENIALQKEAAQRFATTESQIQLLKNELTALAIDAFDRIQPELVQIIQGTRGWVAANREAIASGLVDFMQATLKTAEKLAPLLVEMARSIGTIANIASSLPPELLVGLAGARFAGGLVSRLGGAATAGAAGLVATAGPAAAAAEALAFGPAFAQMAAGIVSAGRQLDLPLGEKLPAQLSLLGVRASENATKITTLGSAMAAAGRAAENAARLNAIGAGVSGAGALASGAATFKQTGIIGVAAEGALGGLVARLTPFAAAIGTATLRLIPFAAGLGAVLLALRALQNFRENAGRFGSGQSDFESPDVSAARNAQDWEAARERDRRAFAATEVMGPFRSDRERALAERQMRRAQESSVFAPTDRGAVVPAQPTDFLPGADRAAANAEAAARRLDAERQSLQGIVQLRQQELQLMEAHGASTDALLAQEDALRKAKLDVIAKDEQSLRAQLAGAQALASVSASDADSAKKQIEAQGQIAAIQVQLKALATERQVIEIDTETRRLALAQQSLEVDEQRQQAAVSMAGVAAEDAQARLQIAQQEGASRGELLSMAQQADALAARQLEAERALLVVQRQRLEASAVEADLKQAQLGVADAQIARLDAALARQSELGGENLRSLLHDGESGFDRLINATQGWGRAFTDQIAEGKIKAKDLISSILQDINKMLVQTFITDPILGMVKSGVGGLRDSFLMGGVKGFGSEGFVGPPTEAEATAAAAESAWTGAAARVQGAWGGLVKFVGGGFQSIFGGLSQAVQSIWNTISGLFGGGGGGGLPEWASALVNIGISALGSAAGSSAGSFANEASARVADAALAPRLERGGIPIRYHAGGIVGLDGIPRFHGGWDGESAANLAGVTRTRLASDEVMAILQRGETVLPRSARGGRKAGKPVVQDVTHIHMTPTITVQALDPRGVTDVLIENRGTLRSLWLDDIERGGAAARAVRRRR